MTRLYSWLYALAILGCATFIALVESPTHLNDLDWFLVGAFIVTAVAFAAEAIHYAEDHR
jgi:hypothetical protein